MKKQLFLKNLETIFLALASEIKNLTMISCPSASMSGWESSGLSYVQGFDAAPINKRNEGCKNCMFQVFSEDCPQTGLFLSTGLLALL
ncbi:hypothetical protein DCAR_0830800 [Daucus carota subsp. sativus]|uniref:Uncharacterized protein n=1 Tax=Daucus carota subsp. sativus TaxID=79200 RepID=A0A175YJZ6_DAUCS|nr:hypothetical protein DCAR_0830800 [Daucus carota subsp. sativus]